MTQLRVKRWTRYGKDRFYVNLPDGSRVGWLDLQTGDVTLERQDLAQAFEAAISEYRRSLDAAGAPTDEPHAHAPAPPPRSTSEEPPSQDAADAAGSEQEPFWVEIGWRDLASNRAGHEVRERARQERQAAPVRTFAARLLGVHTDERAWRIGADGEEKVGARLARLPDTWEVVHSLPVGDRDADIDHFVVGPGGVFTINTKHHPDARVWVGGNTFMVNGQRQPYVRNSRHEAARAARLLSSALATTVEVAGVIAVVGAHKGFTVKEQPDDVHVVTRKGLTRWLLSRPQRLAPDQVEAIFAAARRSDTWR